MVAKRSEYQNQFKSSVVKKHHDIYMTNLALRHERRDREFMHTPLCWMDVSPDDDAICSDNSERDVQSPPETKETETQEKEVYQSLAEIMAEAKEKAEALRKQKMLAQSKPTGTEKPRIERSSMEESADINKSTDEKEVADKSLSIYDIVDKENRKLNQKIAQTYVFDKEREGKCVEVNDEDLKKVERRENYDLTKESNLRKMHLKKRTFKKSSAPRSHKTKTSVGQERSHKIRGTNPPQPVASNSVPSLSPTSLASQRPARPDRQSRISQVKKRPTSANPALHQSRPPFLAYGAADVEDNLALHRTHNVLAPADVYPLALRAKSRREEEQRRSKERKFSAKQCTNAEDLLDRLSSMGLTPRDDWASEYSLQFHGYEPSEYQRSISARSVLPRAASSSFMPVRSGGCRVIHVD